VLSVLDPDLIYEDILVTGTENVEQKNYSQTKTCLTFVGRAWSCDPSSWSLEPEVDLGGRVQMMGF
jgi:hypothetical protein